jgi:hypothetical protein
MQNMAEVGAVDAKFPRIKQAMENLRTRKRHIVNDGQILAASCFEPSDEGNVLR